MRKIVQTAGFILVLMGISGAIDHLATQPIMGLFLNAFNRLVVSQVDFFTGYEVLANLLLSVVGLVMIIAGNQLKES